jgi:hypothetical protein
MQRRRILIPAISIVIGMCILISFLMTFLGYQYYKKIYLPSTISFPAPIVNVDFPEEEIYYPTDWPKVFIFPSDMILVDYSLGVMSDQATRGWSAKYRFKGNPVGAKNLLEKFIEKNKWVVTKNTKIDSGGYVILFSIENGEGIAVIYRDSNDESQSLILVTLIP